MRTIKKAKKDIFIILWITLGMIVILGFFVFSTIIGGTAGNGYQENSHFFLSEHGEIVEVSQMIWQISRVWGILFWIFIPLTPIGAFLIEHIQEKTQRKRERFE